LQLAIGRAYAKPSTEGRLHYVSALLHILDLELSEGAIFAILLRRGREGVGNGVSEILTWTYRSYITN
jgi:hypothetical protein